jgi:hypothetical protein
MFNAKPTTNKIQVVALAQCMLIPIFVFLFVHCKLSIWHCSFFSFFLYSLAAELLQLIICFVISKNRNNNYLCLFVFQLKKSNLFYPEKYYAFACIPFEQKSEDYKKGLRYKLIEY